MTFALISITLAIQPEEGKNLVIFFTLAFEPEEGKNLVI